MTKYTFLQKHNHTMPNIGYCKFNGKIEGEFICNDDHLYRNLRSFIKMINENIPLK